MLGITALTLVIVIPLVVAWPIAGYVVYLVWRHGKRHDERERLEREQQLAAGHTSP
ncbi:MAG TPA: hypothetical protein VG265_16505 [Gaiellaceae bacterium]|jgi:heme/copper-type cytochrome/quinol oxidase subunit 2|nr:hypothetical protein [Gaiellaceae bacterium]